MLCQRWYHGDVKFNHQVITQNSKHDIETRQLLSRWQIAEQFATKYIPTWRLHAQTAYVRDISLTIRRRHSYSSRIVLCNGTYIARKQTPEQGRFPSIDSARFQLGRERSPSEEDHRPSVRAVCSIARRYGNAGIPGEENGRIWPRIGWGRPSMTALRDVFVRWRSQSLSQSANIFKR